MSFVDLQATFSDKQAITTTAASTKDYDNGAPGTAKHAAGALPVDHGNIEMYLDISVNETFGAASGTPTLTISVEQDDDDAFGSAETLFTTPALAMSTLTAGAKIKELSRIPLGATKRYMRLKYTASAAFNAGKINANLLLGRQTADT